MSNVCSLRSSPPCRIWISKSKFSTRNWVSSPGKNTSSNEQIYGVDLDYLLYQPDALVVLNRNYRTWGPFHHRNNLVRFTATVRKRGDTQLIVRANAQFYLRAVEDPVPYQKFFRTLEQALFLQGQLVD